MDGKHDAGSDGMGGTTGPKGYAGAYGGPGIGHYGDGSTYPIGHTVITANGIKPSGVMGWTHREKPGTPEWERRARARFEEANGGEWRRASDPSYGARRRSRPDRG